MAKNTRALLIGGIDSRAADPVSALADGLIADAKRADAEEQDRTRNVNTGELIALCETVLSRLAESTRALLQQTVTDFQSRPSAPEGPK